jgi:hypothetical protein
MALLRKPFTSEALDHSVRSALAARQQRRA